MQQYGFVVYFLVFWNNVFVSGDNDYEEFRLYDLLQRRASSSSTAAKHHFQKQVLSAHNVYRARHCAPPLKLDEKLNHSAKKYAELLAVTNKLEHSDTPDVGENLFQMISSQEMKINIGLQAITTWYDENSAYDYNNPVFSYQTAHFTQIVWKETTKLGVGWAFGRYNSQYTLYVVAQYYVAAIENILVVKIFPDSVYNPQSSCAFLNNVSNLATLQNCIWTCQNQVDCHTAVYFNDENKCSLYAEHYSLGQVLPSLDVRSSVTAYNKNYVSTITCPSTVPTTVEQTTIAVTESSRCLLYVETGNNNSSKFFSVPNENTYSSNIPSIQLQNNVSCIKPGIRGYDAALSFSLNSFQNVQVNYSYYMRNTSFTITAWVYYDQNLTDMGIVGQCQHKDTCFCLHLNIRYQKIYFGFYNCDLSGVTVLEMYRWYHVAAVYDVSGHQQIIYLDGVVDTSQISSPYQGFNPAIVMGQGVNNGAAKFSGMIDRVSLYRHVLNATHVLEKATLVVYYSFDNSINLDSGPNQINNTNLNVSSTNGHLNNGLLFPQLYSYLQIQNLILLGDSNHSYSFSLWMYPSINHTNGTIIRITSTNNWYLPVLGFNSNGQLVAQSTNGSFQSILGPVLSSHQWIHVALTYQRNRTLNLYINGSLYNESDTFVYKTSGQPVQLTLGYAETQTILATNSILAGQFFGTIDEFRLYSRALNSTEVLQLANQ